MLRKVEKNAKNLDDALLLAAEELGVTTDELGYEVIQEMNRGFLSLILGKEITISAWVKADAPKESPKESSKESPKESSKESPKENSKGTNVNSKTKTESANSKPKAEIVNNKPKTENTNKKAKSDNTSKKPKSESNPSKLKASDDKTAGSGSARRNHGRTPVEIIPKESVDDAKYFIDNLLSKMGLNAKTSVRIGTGCIDVNVEGEKMSLIIGKRGDTLDAIQYLTNLYVNRNKSGYIKVNIDTEGYRKKREETLVNLAHSIERRVIREKKSYTLEPMNPNERRIIHAALQANTSIRTYSVGDEPNRKIVVALNRQ